MARPVQITRPTMVRLPIASIFAVLVGACASAGPSGEAYPSIQYARQDPLLSPAERQKMKPPPPLPKGGVSPYAMDYSAMSSGAGGGFDYDDRAVADAHRPGAGIESASGSIAVADPGEGARFAHDDDGPTGGVLEEVGRGPDPVAPAQ